MRDPALQLRSGALQKEATRARVTTFAACGRPPPCARRFDQTTWHADKYRKLTATSSDTSRLEQRGALACLIKLELLAAVSVYYSLRVDLRGREVIHFTDNACALACLIKKYSSDVDSARLVLHTFWALSSSLEIDVCRFEFVYSEANVAADWPSRGEFGFAADLGALACAMEVPRSDSWGGVGLMLGLSDSAPAEPLVRSHGAFEPVFSRVYSCV